MHPRQTAGGHHEVQIVDGNNMIIESDEAPQPSGLIPEGPCFAVRPCLTDQRTVHGSK